MISLDSLDVKLLAALQADADRPLEALGEAVGLSRNACWRRIRRLEEAGVILRRTALLDPAALGLSLVAFIAVRTNRHDAAWADAFSRVVAEEPAIVGAYRTAGAVDYLLHARVADVAAYDALYQRLIKKVELTDVSASFAMETLKETSALPLPG